MPAIQSELIVQRFGTTTLVELPGGINMVKRNDLDRICAEIDRLIEQADKPRLMISFAQVSHVSSMFLGKLIAFNKRIKARGGELTVSNIKPNIKELLRLTKLDTQITIVSAESTTAQKTGAAWATLGVIIACGVAAVALCVYRMAVGGRSDEGFRTPARIVAVGAVYLIAAVAQAGLIAALRKSNRKLSQGLTWYAAAAIAVLAVGILGVVTWLG